MKTYTGEFYPATWYTKEVYSGVKDTNYLSIRRTFGSCSCIRGLWDKKLGSYTAAHKDCKTCDGKGMMPIPWSELK